MFGFLSYVLRKGRVVRLVLGTFRNGESIIPVKLEIKQNRNIPNNLYLVVAMTKIKETDVMGSAHDDGISSNNSLPVTDPVYSISQIVSKINPQDGRRLLRSKRRQKIMNLPQMLLSSQIYPRKKQVMKSPFFRAWFGDWRAYDISPIQFFIMTKIEGKNPRGTFVNKDTGWSITSSSVGYDETNSHRGKDKKSLVAMQNIDQIIENSILLDTEVSDYGRGKKSIYTSFMHKFYSPVLIDGKPYIAKMAVDESYLPGQKETNKKFYHVIAIEIEKVPTVGIGEDHTPIMVDTNSIISIADLFELVKTYDKDFNPKHVNKAMLNEDGTAIRLSRFSTRSTASGITMLRGRSRLLSLGKLELVTDFVTDFGKMYATVVANMELQLHM